MNPQRHLPISGFSLTELLVVICIMALLAAASGPAINSMTRGNRVDAAAANIAGLLEQAREYAIAQNTYVFIALYPESTATYSTVTVIAAASKDGTNPLETNANLGTINTSTCSVALINRPITYDQVDLAEPGDTGVMQQFASDKRPTPTTNATNALANSVTVTMKLLTSSTMAQFRRTLVFTPSGMPKIGDNTTNLIEFSLKPKRNISDNGNSNDSHNVAMVRVNGITGQTHVYRP